MTKEENRIIRFHKKIAMWSAMNSQAFDDYCTRLSLTKNGINDVYYSFFKMKIFREMHRCGNGYHTKGFANEKDHKFDCVSDYHNFCTNRLVEESDFFLSDDESTKRGTDEWYNFFNDGVINHIVLSSLCQDEDPLDILSKEIDQEIKPATVLSFCDDSKKQIILFDALVSLLFNAILQEKEPDVRTDCCKLLQDVLIDNTESEFKYSRALSLYSALAQLGSDVCEYFFRGFGISIEKYDLLLSFIDKGEEDGAIHEIVKLRNKKFLGSDSILIEHCFDFKKAQVLNQYIDWFGRNSFKSHIQSINAFLLNRIKEEHILSQGVIKSLMTNICLDFNFEAVKLTTKEKNGGNTKPQVEVTRYISFSMRHVDKDRFINMLIDKGYVSADPNREEVEKRLNYFFMDSSSVKPSDPKFTVTWTKAPKNQLVCLLIRMLLTKTWDFQPEQVVVRNVEDGKGKRIYPGINSTIIDNLSNSEIIWEIVNSVFCVSNAAIGTFNCRYKSPQKHLDKLVELAKDILNCKK